LLNVFVQLANKRGLKILYVTHRQRNMVAKISVMYVQVQLIMVDDVENEMLVK
jgi:hypothetical protein